MAIDREQIAAALFTTITDAVRFVTVNRRLRHWNDVSPAEQPALFMSEKGGEVTTEGRTFNMPVIHTLHFDFYIYAHSSNPHLSPAMVLNPLVDAVERVLSPTFAPGGSVTGFNTLGLDGMVRWARVHGRVATDEGVLGDQAMAIVPIEVRAV
jgi:hypothetical protein